MDLIRLNILIIDDDEIDQRQLKRAISKSDLLVNVTIIDNPVEAIQHLKTSKFDCCFIDYLMPEMNGIELVKAIREFDKHTAIIIVTSQSDQELSKEAITSGATNYTTKSLINPEGVSLLIRNSLQLQKIEGELEAAKNEALKLAQIKQDFLANMSHEIRTPLNAINGFSDLLKQTDLNVEQKEYVDILNVASKNLSNLINDILDVSKIESGELKFELNSTDLISIVNSVVQIEGPKAKKKGIDIVLYAEPNMPTKVLCDETRVMQVLLNLVSNAIKFTPKGHVKISINELERVANTSVISIVVEDSGIGMPQEKLATIFDRFTQAEESTTRLYGGTGLGLNIVRKLVEIMNGEIQVKSELGIGSQFILKIPFELPAKNDVTKISAQQHINNKVLLDKKILVVEDNEHNQLLIKTYLQKNGAKVWLADNGKEAITLMTENNYNVILMDLQMPIMDGFQTTDFIRNTLKSDVPIIACSASSSGYEKENCLAKGMNDYIAKPYSEKGLIETIMALEETAFSEKITKENFVDSSDNFEELFKNITLEYGAEFKNEMLNISRRIIHKDISNLEEAIKTNNVQEIRNISHKFIGSFASLNFPNGTCLARDTESSVLENNIENMKVLSYELLSYLKNYQLFLDND